MVKLGPGWKMYGQIGSRLEDVWSNWVQVGRCMVKFGNSKLVTSDPLNTELLIQVLISVITPSTGDSIFDNTHINSLMLNHTCSITDS